MLACVCVCVCVCVTWKRIGEQKHTQAKQKQSIYKIRNQSQTLQECYTYALHATTSFSSAGPGLLPSDVPGTSADAANSGKGAKEPGLCLEVRGGDACFAAVWLSDRMLDDHRCRAYQTALRAHLHTIN